MTLSLRDVSLRVRDGRTERVVLEHVTVDFAPPPVTAHARTSATRHT